METQHQEGIASSSPSHEFSFTISLNHPIPSKIPDNNYTNTNKSINRNPNPLHQQPRAIDLSPADDIFFHGHLLPLRHLSDVPVSPRSSTNSLDSFTLPIKELVRQDNNHRTLTSSVDDHHHPKTSSKLDETHHQSKSFIQEDNSTRLLLQEGKAIKEKSKSFSLFTNRKKPPLPRHHDQEKNNDRRGLQRKKSTFEILKRYLSSVKPFLSLRKGNKGFDQAQVAGRPYSLSSGNLRGTKNKKELRGKRGELSAPASMGASPTNSGRLIASGTISPIISKSDSTMEELQAAIQAAIAHCKKSIAAEDAIKFP